MLIAQLHRLRLPRRCRCIPRLTASLVALSLVSVSVSADETSDNRAGLELFEKKIRPALIRYCYECHAVDSDDVGGELLLDSSDALLRGGETGPTLVPGEPRDSLLMRAIEYRDLEMPPDQKLPDDLIRAFRRWIALGAPDPRQQSSSQPADAEQEQPNPKPVDLWSLHPIQETAPPEPGDSTWPRNGVDRFVFDKLHKQGLKPNGDTSPTVLIRRLYFDLVGLPPSPADVAAFVADPSDHHYEAIVDRLLASTQFGERWGRHWLDVARYGESAGSSRDVLMPYAWRYRDYVLDSFNRDVPFDEFVTQQVAGDLLPHETEDEKRRNSVATGFLAIGSKSLNGGNLTYDIIDDQIDVVSKSVLGLTVSCARCHDHKFDPIPTRDYYSLAGFFLSTDTRYGGGIKRPKNATDKAKLYLSLDAPLPPEEATHREQAARKVAQLQKQVAASRKRVSGLAKNVPEDFRGDTERVIPESLTAADAKRIRQYQSATRLLAQRKAQLEEASALLGPEPDYALGVTDAKRTTDAKVLVRGEKGQLGENAPRGYLSALGEFCQPGPIEKETSGRQQLARWLVHPDNPLTARVAANRIWQHLMGSGIVTTVDNFGVSGTKPSHPELLDYLAYRFAHTHDWSIKKLIRELVRARTYRLSSQFDEKAFEIDPGNRLRWRMPRRRLEAEPLRDAMLAASGLLDLAAPQGSLVMQIGEGEVGRNLDTSILDKPFDHRSVYLPIIRGIIPEELRLFDFPEPSNVQGMRDSNTTPTQSLFLMNSPFAMRVADAFAGRLLQNESLQDDPDRVRRAHLLCFGREPSDQQIERDLRYINVSTRRSIKKSVAQDESARIAWRSYCQSLVASAPFRYID